MKTLLFFVAFEIYLLKFEIPIYARVAELVDALDSKSSSFGSAGSIPAPGTKTEWETERKRSLSSVFSSFCALTLLLTQSLSHYIIVERKVLSFSSLSFSIQNHPILDLILKSILFSTLVCFLIYSKKTRPTKKAFPRRETLFSIKVLTTF